MWSAHTHRVCIYNGILFSHKKEKYYNMDEL
jgi:hypothetical protein